MHQQVFKIRDALARQALRGALAGAIGLALLGLQACAGSGGQAERWDMVEQRAPQPAPQATAPARQPVAVVFYREAGSGADAATPVNVYINGQYQASLVGNTYTEQALCPGSHRLKVAYNDVQRRYVSKDEGLDFAIGTEPVQYFRVTEAGAGVAAIAAVPSETAQAARTSLSELQHHTIPRVVRNGCAAS
ncbi:MAG TPA: hypothetical protein PKA16_01510 [Ottowia sp.]|uniref:hypothetical protein n=1 Tax=Ottowia sp. TaxID=1898956 RepID=UPI002CD3F435|nr:hypothetical protein [Ottowia sp.]HMN20048.1 hypothetical protein [Ottowia sp.]